MRRDRAVAWAFLLLSCGGARATESGRVPVVAPAKWELAWADEFNGTSLDTTSWIANDGASNVNNELQYYTPSEVYLENGALVLRSQQRAMGGRAYTSGEVRSGAKHTVRMGNAIEWRTASPSGKGIWPANWLVNTPCDGLHGCGESWPPEIDVMEIRGSAPDVNLMTHWWRNPAGVQHETSEFAGNALSTGYHTYRVEWFADSIAWYVDGVQRAKHTSNITTGVMQIVMNTAVGGDFDGAPSATTIFPQYQRIDYVRVYRDVANSYPQ
ncbi:MAG: glycoside hydrolase family 16 protein [bacterium]